MVFTLLYIFHTHIPTFLSCAVELCATLCNVL